MEHLKTLHSNLCMEVLEHGSRKKKVRELFVFSSCVEYMHVSVLTCVGCPSLE